jgi:acyl-coenzyme A synthetase/AMP-(fatty) acid ligase
MMLLSPRNPVEHQRLLLQQTDCETIFCAQSFMARVPSMLGGDSTVVPVVVPELGKLLDSTQVEPFPYNVTFDVAKDDPFMILHTSGSTGECSII